MLELGDLYDAGHLDAAAAAIFRHNWLTGFFDHANPQRIYAQDEESGLLLCTWPRGGRPAFPFPYSEEVWTGIEYTTAALLAYRGLVNEALAVVKAVRDRHDGTRRNPFDEFECGHHYARAMASWAVLNALTGFAADLPARRLAFFPRVGRGREFAAFFGVGTGWGLYRQRFAGTGTGALRGRGARGIGGNRDARRTGAGGRVRGRPGGAGPRGRRSGRGDDVRDRPGHRGAPGPGRLGPPGQDARRGGRTRVG